MVNVRNEVAVLKLAQSCSSSRGGMEPAAQNSFFLVAWVTRSHHLTRRMLQQFGVLEKTMVSPTRKLLNLLCNQGLACSSWSLVSDRSNRKTSAVVHRAAAGPLQIAACSLQQVEVAGCSASSQKYPQHLSFF